MLTTTANKRNDWSKIVNLSFKYRFRSVFASKSKDLPLAAWSNSAWVRLSRSTLVPTDFLWRSGHETQSAFWLFTFTTISLDKSRSNVTHTDSSAILGLLHLRRRLLQAHPSINISMSRMQTTAIRTFFQLASVTVEYIRMKYMKMNWLPGGNTQPH